MKTISEVWPEWNIEKEIGRGSYGTVYKCSKEINGVKEYSAIKVIAVPQSEYEMIEIASEKMTNEQSKKYYKDIADDLVKEIEILKTLKGTKNIVEIYDAEVVEKEDGIGWYILIRMELLTDFNTYSSDKKFTEAEVIKLGLDISSALSVCHKAKIIHRDIKPENIFVDADGNFKLGDFGVAKRMEKTQGSMSIKGTYNYMSPEVFSGKKSDGRADMYSLALVMYKLLNNDRLPFLDPDKQLIRYNERQLAFEKRIQGEQIPDIKGASKYLNDIILKACTFKNTDRQRNINEFKKQLEKVAKGKKVFSRKKKTKIVDSITVLVCVFAIAVAGYTNKETIKSYIDDISNNHKQQEETLREHSNIIASLSSIMDSKESYNKYLNENYYLNETHYLDLEAKTKTDLFELLNVDSSIYKIGICNDKYIYYYREINPSEFSGTIDGYEIYRYDIENKNKEFIISSNETSMISCLYFDDTSLYFVELEPSGEVLKRLDLKEKTLTPIVFEPSWICEYKGFIIYIQNGTGVDFNIATMWCYDTVTQKFQKISDSAFPLGDNCCAVGDNIYFKEYVLRDDGNEGADLYVSKYNLNTGKKEFVSCLDESGAELPLDEIRVGCIFNDKFAIIPLVTLSTDYIAFNLEKLYIWSFEDKNLSVINWPKEVEMFDYEYCFTDKTITENLLFIEYKNDSARLYEILPSGEMLQRGNELFIDNLSEDIVRIGSKLVDLNTSGENIIIYDFFEGESTKR